MPVLGHDALPSINDRTLKIPATLEQEKLVLDNDGNQTISPQEKKNMATAGYSIDWGEPPISAKIKFLQHHWHGMLPHLQQEQCMFCDATDNHFSDTLVSNT